MNNPGLYNDTRTKKICVVYVARYIHLHLHAQNVNALYKILPFLFIVKYYSDLTNTTIYVSFNVIDTSDDNYVTKQSSY